MKSIHFKSFILGMVITAIIMSAVIAGNAALRSENALIYFDNYKVMYQGKEINAVDPVTNVKLEPFSYNGWIYLPAEQFGYGMNCDVAWDGNTNTLSLYQRNNTGVPVSSVRGGIIDKYFVEVVGLRFANDYQGNKCVVVKYAFTNNDSDSTSFMWSIDDKVYQNGVELSKPIMTNGINNDDKSKNVMPGSTNYLEIPYTLTGNTDLTFELDKFLSFGGNYKITFSIPYSDIK